MEKYEHYAQDNRFLHFKIVDQLLKIGSPASKLLFETSRMKKSKLNIHYFTDDLKRTTDPNRQKSASQINRPDIHSKPTKTNLNILIKRRLINRFFEPRNPDTSLR